jgi:hypothetical protein
MFRLVPAIVLIFAIAVLPTVAASASGEAVLSHATGLGWQYPRHRRRWG